MKNTAPPNGAETEEMPETADALYPIAPPLLSWFSLHKRSLPFREDPTPYHVWVSEIMLQQTRMQAVLPYYTRFMAALPDVQSLAACDDERLRKLWEGLGYYSRVRHLKKAAQMVCDTYGGEIPADYAALLRLPGIGAYTAGAIASISFGMPVPAVDGNVLRVFARLYREKGEITDPAVKTRITRYVQAQLPPDAPGDFNQALMELGAMVCTPASPDCGVCPLRELCRGQQAGVAASLPKKAEKKPRRVVPVTVLLVHHAERGWLLVRRPETGLLAGLWQPPAWEDAAPAADVREMLPALAAYGVTDGDSTPLPPATHVFTHVEWHMTGWRLEAHALSAAAAPPETYRWVTDGAQDAPAIPSAFRRYRAIMGI